MKEIYAVLPSAEQGNFFHFELSSAWLVEADSSYDVRHCAASQEFIVIRTHRGEGEVELTTRRLRPGADTLLVVRSFELLRYRTREDEWVFSWWTGRGVGVEPFEPGRIYPVADSTGVQLDEEVIRKLQSPGAMTRRRAVARFQELFWRWLPENGGAFSKLAPALEYMHHRLNRPVGMEQLAQRCGMSLRHFRRCFLAGTGKTPKAYWEELRLHTALGWLRNRGLTLKEVAAE